MKYGMDQVHYLIKSVDLVFIKALVENPNINVRVKDYFLLHPLDFLKSKSSSVFQGCFCKLKIGVKLLYDGVYGFLFRFCFQCCLDPIDLILIQFNGFFYKRHVLPPFYTYNMSKLYGFDGRIEPAICQEVFENVLGDNVSYSKISFPPTSLICFVKCVRADTMVFEDRFGIKDMVILKVPNLVMKSLYVERIQKMLLPEPEDRDDGREAAKTETARYLDLPIITNDAVIRDSKFVEVLE